METFPPEKILAVWEAGREQHAVDRALTLLATACPEATRDELAALSIGERDARLLRLRTGIFGTRAEGFAQCPECATRFELPIDTAAFAHPPDTAGAREMECAGTRLCFRLPNSRDLAEVVASPDEEQGLRRLIERCVLEVSGDGAGNRHERPPEFLGALSRAMLAADPCAEINVSVECPDCGCHWSLLFDIVDFLWDELAAHAHRLLREIDLIAGAYGWSEREILSLPARRRRSYVELIAG